MADGSGDHRRVNIVPISEAYMQSEGVVMRGLSRERLFRNSFIDPSAQNPISLGQMVLLSMAIIDMGYNALSLTGSQAGIVTDTTHTKARIVDIRARRIHEALEAGNIVIVAGFQGVSTAADVTTLGRGGSDTTAVALAAALQADVCEIYTDVDGVYTTDPRIVPEAGKIDRINYDEMLELASLGAGVMHSRSIEFAKKYGVPIHVRSSFSDAPGTWIVGEQDARRLGVAVTGAALAKDEARITILGVPDRPGVVHLLFQTIARANIVVDMIVQNVATEGATEVSFTVARGDLAETLRAAAVAANQIGARGVTHDAEVAKVSVIGLGMRAHTGVATAMFEAIAAVGINIQMITTSEIKITVLVDRAAAVAALRAVHKAFLLDEVNAWPQLAFFPARSTTRAMKLVPLADPDANGPREQGMEDLVIAGVELDETQGRITLYDVPDRPGYAARVFQAIADAGVFVDMIVQNVSQDGQCVLSFTVPREAVNRAAEAVTPIAGGQISIEPAMAKLSVIGVGMRTHTGVATRMFGALADRSININLINTSEIRINVGTDVAKGKEGLDCLRKVFALNHES